MPLLLREALAHGGGGVSDGAQVVADAGGLAAAGQAGDQSPLEHAARLRGGRHGAEHQHVAHGHRAEPGQQWLAGLIFDAEALQDELGQPSGVFGALGVAAQPEQVFGGAAGHGAAVAQRHRGPGGGRVALGARSGRAAGRGAGAGVGAIAQHPDIGAAAAVLHGGDVFIFTCDSRQAAG